MGLPLQEGKGREIIRNPFENAPDAVLMNPPAVAPPAWTCRTLIFILGATGLAGQVCWSRIAAASVGGATASSAVTLSGAMAGLSAGALISGLLLIRVRARLLLMSIILASAAALLGMPWLLLAVNAFEGSLTTRRVICAALLALAHMPFGAILPAATLWRGVQKTLGDEAGDLYAVSAFGAATGGVLTGEVLAERLGLDIIGVFLSLVTLATIGLLFVSPRPALFSPKQTPQATHPLSLRVLLAIAFGLGLLGLASETLWMRALGFFWQATTRSYSLVTGGYIAGLALGSLSAHYVVSRWRTGIGGLASACGFAAASLILVAFLSEMATDATSVWQRVFVAAFLVGLPAFFFGAVFVCLLECAGSGRDSRRTLSLICGLNNAGSAAGPLVLWIAMPDHWPAYVFISIAVGYAVLAAVSLHSNRLRMGIGLTGAAGIALLGYCLAPREPPPSTYSAEDRLPKDRDFGAVVVPFLSHGMEATVAVTRHTDTGVEELWIDRAIQGDTSLLGRRVQERQGRLPCELLGRPAKRALVIGLGTGITVASMAGSAEKVDVAELSAGVIEANCTILADANGHVASRPNVQLCHGDGRSILSDAAQPYDLIVTDIVFPSVPGAGNLFSREFYDLVRRKLTPDGLFVHWLPCFQLSHEDLSAITSGFLQSFPEGSAWIGYLDAKKLILGLASKWPRRPDATLSRFALGSRELRELAGDVPPIRDADPRLEYRSPPRQDHLYGTENLKHVLALMRSSKAFDDSATPEQQQEWTDIRQAWILFAEAGLTALQAEAADSGSSHSFELLDRRDALYKKAAETSARVGDTDFVLQELEFERLLAEAASADARGDVNKMSRMLRMAADDPIRAEGNFQWAASLARLRQSEQAVVELRYGIAKYPRSADAHFKVAMLLFNTGDYVQSKKAFELAVALRPDHPKIYDLFEEQIRRASREKN